jgi:hypothetical protein
MVSDQVNADEANADVVNGSCPVRISAVRSDAAVRGLPLLLLQPLSESERRCTRGEWFVPEQQFKWLAGESDVKHFDLPGAKRFSVAFCQQCGTRVPHKNPHYD